MSREIALPPEIGHVEIRVPVADGAVIVVRQPYQYAGATALEVRVERPGVRPHALAQLYTVEEPVRAALMRLYFQIQLLHSALLDAGRREVTTAMAKAKGGKGGKKGGGKGC